MNAANSMEIENAQANVASVYVDTVKLLRIK